MKQIALLALMLMLWTAPAAAQCSALEHTCTASAHTDAAEEIVRPVMSAYTLQAGSSHLADTYLSPLKFSGWHTGIGYERMQAMKFSPEHWVMRLALDVNLDRAVAPRGAALWYGGLDFSWGMMRRWEVMPHLTLAVGGEAALDAGVVYNSRNGNNPASAKAAITLGATGYAAYNTRLLGVPVTLRYQPSLPVIGAFFAPDYGELYYEIYMGNHRNLAHCAWWGNYLQSRHLLVADLHFGGTALRVGYAGNFLSTKINHTVTHIFSHSLVFGISGEWISLNPRKPVSKNAKIISSTF